MRSTRFTVLFVALAATFLSTSVSRGGIILYDAFLSGPGESPPNVSPGTGLATVTIDNVANTMEVDMSFSGLLGTTTASHIHAATALPGTGTAGVATTTPTLTGFPLGVTSGTYDHVFDLTSSASYNPAYITANGGTPISAEAALLASMSAGTSYLNIHTTVVPGGEIRGFLTPAVPEPGTVALIALGTIGILGYAWRKRQRSVS